MSNKTIKALSRRFAESHRIYSENTDVTSRQLKQQEKAAKAGSATPRSKTLVATKTIATRRALHGPKATTGAGIQSIRKANPKAPAKKAANK